MQANGSGIQSRSLRQSERPTQQVIEIHYMYLSRHLLGVQHCRETYGGFEKVGREKSNRSAEAPRNPSWRWIDGLCRHGSSRGRDIGRVISQRKLGTASMSMKRPGLSFRAWSSLGPDCWPLPMVSCLYTCTCTPRRKLQATTLPCFLSPDLQNGRKRRYRRFWALPNYYALYTP